MIYCYYDERAIDNFELFDFLRANKVDFLTMVQEPGVNLKKGLKAVVINKKSGELIIADLNQIRFSNVNYDNILRTSKVTPRRVKQS